MSNKVYDQLGLTKDEVIEMQKWLFQIIHEKDRISDMIKEVSTVMKDKGAKLWYALYILGNEMGQAQIKEQFGVAHILDPENV